MPAVAAEGGEEEERRPRSPEEHVQRDDEPEVAQQAPKRRKRKRNKDAHVSDDSPPKDKSGGKQKRRRRSNNPAQPEEEEERVDERVPEPTQTSSAHDDDNDDASCRKGRAMTGAEAELQHRHKLHRPYDVRPSGEFSDDERELIRRKIRQYQQAHGLSVADLVALIQFTKPYRSSTQQQGNPQVEARQIAMSTRFWAHVYDALPERKNNKAMSGTTGIQRFVRRKYHSFKGSGGWTEEEDELLAQLQEAHPNSWKLISQTMGDRDPTACRDRWRNYLQYGERRATHTWSEEEMDMLESAVETVISIAKQERADAGQEPLPEYTSRHINWKAVAQRVGSRSRLQCLMKWKSLQEQREREAMFSGDKKRKRKRKQSRA
ncbi:uncharacterized protein EI97DRAFT_89301 [Westerdykella ornata]|uniref:Uncharacterized protein n=1 Tax=Westerdykella ornata TaxID=318751 RepID=A0A6A6JF35_WESOR|nr:uncharacterized protein EI97DRAFT_89301 [Westerdykella ornata]KAF2274793.1 hypothetical protein EI97DRAFT_89301 [Westerdykella ornata]